MRWKHIAVAAVAAAGLAGAGGDRGPRNAREFDELFRRVSNAGRWGKDDQLGSLNLITGAKRRAALQLAKTGTSVSLAHNPMTAKAVDNPSPFEHTLNEGLQTDTYKVNYHGLAHSHIDALCHFTYKDRTYNGYARADVNTPTGCAKLGIETLKDGVITRGILLDMPRLKSVPFLEPGTPVYVEDIEAWEKKARVRVSSGDALLLHTGRWVRRAKVGPWDLGQKSAGFHASVAPWLKARGVALIGSDGVLDVEPPGVEGVFAPTHTLVIAALGIHILDSQDFDALAQAAATQNRWEFLLTLAPVPVTGGTGFPVNALAIF